MVAVIALPWVVLPVDILRVGGMRMATMAVDLEEMVPEWLGVELVGEARAVATGMVGLSGDRSVPGERGTNRPGEARTTDRAHRTPLPVRWRWTRSTRAISSRRTLVGKLLRVAMVAEELLGVVERALERRRVLEAVRQQEGMVVALGEAEVVQLAAVDSPPVEVPEVRAKRVQRRPVARRRSERPADGDRPGKHARTLRHPRKPSIRTSRRTVCVIRSPSAR
uniref:(northern house mosquito) hypothetical protein n=1 Tax=Culex pipiens TaxID=7175 RepID=A0A8D8BVR9_CULPI